MIQSIKNNFDSAVNCVFSEQTKEKIKQISNKVCSFISEHKGILFFGATAAFVAMNALPGAREVVIGSIFVSGIVTACAMQFFSTLVGSKGLADEQSDEKISFLLGSINLSVWYLHPEAGLAMSIFNTAIKGCSLAFRHIFKL